MNRSYLIFVFFLVFTSCSSTKELKYSKEPFVIDDSNYNTSFKNEEFKESIKKFVGKIDENQLKKVRKQFIDAIGYDLDFEKAIVINYHQRAKNCIEIGNNGSYFLGIYKRGVQISKRISRTNNANDFFIFSKDYFDLRFVDKRKNWLLDKNDFFYNNVFTLHENCSAFFILKPNGEFMKYYGSDYYTKVKNFLKK